MTTELPGFAKMAPALCHVPGLFVSPSKGAPEQLMHVSHEMGALHYRFVGPQLGPVEWRVLTGLMAFSAMQNPPVASAKVNDPLAKMQVLLSRSASVTTHCNQLAQAIGYGANSGSVHALIRRALGRLFAVEVFIRRVADPETEEVPAGRLLSLQDTSKSSKAISVSLCSILAAAVRGRKGEYQSVSLDEVRRLKSDPALLLHRRLHYLNPGAQARPVFVNTLVGYVWSGVATGSALCHRRNSVEEAMEKLRAVGWSATLVPASNVDVDDRYLIGRPA